MPFLRLGNLVAQNRKKKQKEEPMNFDNNSGNISFSYTFKKEDSFPIQIVADGKVLMQYKVVVTEKWRVIEFWGF